MILASTTQAPAQGPMQTLAIQQSQAPVSSGYIATEVPMFPVRVKTSDAKVLVCVDVELLRRQQETEEANEEICRRLRG
jgi:hypothetical protein